MSLQPGGLALVPDTTINPGILQAKLAASQLEASNLRQRVKELTAQLSRHEKSPSNPSGSKPDLEFANLAMLVVTILERLEDTVEVDFANRAILDLAAKPSDRTIARRERAGVFISWLEHNQPLPAVQRLRKAREGWT